jgi:hypothetical protein
MNCPTLRRHKPHAQSLPFGAFIQAIGDGPPMCAIYWDIHAIISYILPRATLGLWKWCYDMGDSQQPGNLTTRQLGNLLAAWELYILVNSAAKQLGSLESWRSTTCQIGAWRLGSSAVSQLSSFEALQFIGTLHLWEQKEWHGQRTSHLLYMCIHMASCQAVSKGQLAPSIRASFPPENVFKSSWMFIEVIT